jgi:mRNA interferase RelE/StbE
VIYRIELSRQADRQLRKLAPNIQSLIGIAIDTLATNPRPSGVKKLRGEENTYRVRVRDYRIVYEIQDSKLVVLIIKIGHRQGVYE